MSKILDLAKKLKALADRGVDGEKDNAIEALDRLMKKHHISLEDIEEKTVFDREVNFGVHRQLMIQCIATISRTIKIYGHAKSKRKFIIEVTDSEFLELEAKFEFYKNDYLKKQKIFLDAYIQSNRLFGEGEATDIKELSPAELERILEIQIMSKSIEKANFHKQIAK